MLPLYPPPPTHPPPTLQGTSTTFICRYTVSHEGRRGEKVRSDLSIRALFTPTLTLTPPRCFQVNGTLLDFFFFFPPEGAKFIANAETLKALNTIIRT